MYLVFDVGGTFVKYAWMNGQGDILEKGKFKTEDVPGGSLDYFLNSLVSVYEQYKEKAKQEGVTIEGIAMGLPGQIDVENGIVYGGGSLKYLHEYHLGEELSKRCDNIRVTMENDGKCAALAEIWKGNAMGCKDACIMVFGTGIGGGIVSDGKVLHGKNLLAGELSFCFDHVTRSDVSNFRSIEDMPDVNDEYKYAPYMWSTYNSTRAFCARVAKAKGLNNDEVDGEKIYAWEETGDSLVHEMLEDYYFDIAKYCCTLYAITNPEVILLGGGISDQPAFLEGVKRYVEEFKRISILYDKIKVDICKHKSSSNLLGALYNFLQIHLNC